MAILRFPLMMRLAINKSTYAPARCLTTRYASIFSYNRKAGVRRASRRKVPWHLCMKFTHRHEVLGISRGEGEKLGSRFATAQGAMALWRKFYSRRQKVSNVYLQLLRPRVWHPGDWVGMDVPSHCRGWN